MKTPVPDNLVIVGCIGKTHGIHGWLKISSYTQPVGNILNYLPWQIDYKGKWQPAEITATKRQGNSILVHFAHCEDPETAQQYTNASIAIEQHQLPPLAKDEVYWKDLVGLSVLTTQGIKLGVVDHIFDCGANDVLVVKGDRERLLPYTKHVIQKVDLQTKSITVDWDQDF